MPHEAQLFDSHDRSMFRCPKAWFVLGVLNTMCMLLFSPPICEAAGLEGPCLGAAGTVCNIKCQETICEALGGLYSATHNVEDPWLRDKGWEQMVSCQQLVAAPGLLQMPVYCNWHGVECCTAELAALGACAAPYAIHALRLFDNRLNGDIADAKFVGSLHQLHECGMQHLDFESNFLWGPMTDELIIAVSNVKYLNLGNNWLEGSIPLAVGQLKNLQYINLAYNSLYGTIPSCFGNLTQLEVLKLGTQAGYSSEAARLDGLQGSIPPELGNLPRLRQLALELNSLTGTLPPDLCPEGGASQLTKLTLQVNYLAGNATSVEGCHKLMELNLAHNAFSGPLPASRHWSQLLIYRAGFNMFTGTLPELLGTQARSLQHVELQHNALTGTLPSVWWLMQDLTTLDISENQISGNLEALLYLPLLSKIDLSHNQFAGTINPAILWSYSLSHVDLSSNPNISGPLPAEMAMLSSLAFFKGTETSLSCDGSTAFTTTDGTYTDANSSTGSGTPGVAASPQCSEEASLPCFLQFKELATPLEDDSSMRCRGVVTKRVEDVKVACKGAIPVDFLPWNREHGSEHLQQQQWLLQPSYFQYRHCECLLGYIEVWHSNHTVLTCVPEHSSNLLQILGIVTAMVSFTAILAAVLNYLSKRSQWLRERQMQAKRAKGVPKALGAQQKVTVSIAVTDIQGYTALTRQYPGQMSQAMVTHNNIMRKACHTHAGHVIHQEGDSWIVAFHEAQDAVAFSLQVQQALTVKYQPGGCDTLVDSQEDLHPPMTPTAPTSACTPDFAAGVQHTPRVTFAKERGVHAVWSEQDSVAVHAIKNQDTANVLSNGSKLTHQGVVFARQHYTGSVEEELQEAQVQDRLHSGSSTNSAGHPGVHQIPQQRLPATLQHLQPCQSSVLMSRDENASSRHRIFRSPTNEHKSWWPGAHLLQKLALFAKGNSVATSAQVVFPRQLSQRCDVCLMVRIGVATGVLHHGCDVKECDVKERARDLVCEAANGGQVLLDQQTFMLVKDSCSLLGSVSHNGYSEQLLKRLAWADAWSRLRKVPQEIGSRWLRSTSRFAPLRQSSSDGLIMRDPRDHDELATLVHLGTCMTASPVADPNACTRSIGGSRDFSTDATATVTWNVAQQQAHNKRASDFGSQADLCSSALASLQFYSIATPGMRHPQDRRWALPIRMQQGWVKTEKGYFEAPGARYEDLVPSTQCSDDTLPPLPEVTIVFVGVADEYVLHSRLGRRKVHHLSGLIGQCMLEQLNALPSGDGYMFHQMETDLKYMLAFEQPDAALQWCFFVQEALMYKEWPAILTSLPECGIVYDNATGQVLFKGPRLRMGVAVGQLNCVQPDQTGRANYFGECVNRAARYMGVAAHGGQVVTDLAVVHDVFHRCAAAAAEQPCGPLETAASLGKLASLRKDMLVAESMSGESDSQQLTKHQLCQPQSWAHSSTPVAEQRQMFCVQTGLMLGAHSGAGVQQLDRSKEPQQLYDSAVPSPMSPSILKFRSFGSVPGASSQVGGLLLSDPHDTVSGTQQHQHSDSIQAWHIGKFAFKGCSEYEMAHVLPSALSGRCFPRDLPKGKGQRLSVASGSVTGLPDVSIVLPEKLAKERYRHDQQHLLLQGYQ